MPKRSTTVPVGTMAPWFDLLSTRGRHLALDAFRGRSWVCLVFMRSRR